MQSVDVNELENFKGKDMGHSDWMQIDQNRINQFADATNDHQWIHINEEKAKAELPTKSTIAHGFLTLDNDAVILRLIEEALNESPQRSIQKNKLLKLRLWEGESEFYTFFQMLAQFGTESVLGQLIDYAINPANEWVRSALLSPIRSASDSTNGFTFFHLFFHAYTITDIVIPVNALN